MNPSRPVNSSQKVVHPRLNGLLSKHAARTWSQPLHKPSVATFLAAEELLNGQMERIVLDSGCGTGESTHLIAASLPDSIVIGVDKSAARLSRTGADAAPRRDGNILWVRADLSTFWRMALKAGWRLDRHYLLYPNPWPKPAQLQRRWHAHPVFPDMLRLGGRLEMRCNWEIYALEFAHTVNSLLGVNVQPGTPPLQPVMSPFERKYRRSGHRIYSVVVSCDSNAVK
jgi:tRNA G46 methylase TrmB